ncbi:GNAT family N-acetyltransferase [Streptomyces sp. NPDC093595]|uniref:GNAT family N-acetyltransferase n=1 Tax=Streptomyces sp. NPDC093595 TaxID=3366045 RepID=UPI0038305272
MPLCRCAAVPGYATAACTALHGHAARELGATDLFAGVTHGNDRSVALLSRLGFEPVADFEDYTRFRLRLVR